MANLNPNSTGYIHTYEPNTNDLSKAIDYNPAGQPIIRVNLDATAGDAFGRMRVAAPFTLFDSTHRFSKNDLWVDSVVGTASSTFSAFEGLVDLDIGSAAGDSLIRETTKVFSYQPGKSLLILNSCTFGPAKLNLTQRVGYFGSDNGMYFEQADTTLYFVERTSVTGALVETRVIQSEWNIDKLDGVGKSGIIIDISKAQLMWIDIEWLGSGTVRLGFVIDGKFIHCHSFHHANLSQSATYTTTASLPLRQEIFNTGITSGNSKSKQICATVISEGGYELSGRQQAVGTSITGPKQLPMAGKFYPVVSIRLKSSRLDAIAIISAMNIMGASNHNFKWEIRTKGLTTNGTWSASSIQTGEYNVSQQLATDLTELISEIEGLGATTAHVAAYGGGEIITAGTYTTAGAATHTGNIVFDAEGNVDAMFVIRCSAAMALGASATSTLINGAKASNIFWLVSAALTIGATCDIKGTYIGSGAVNPGDVFTLEGRIFTKAGAIGMTNATYSRPIGTSSLTLGTLKTFAFFTPSGAISNTVVTGGTGDVCTGLGIISGFANIIGTVYSNTAILFAITQFDNASVSFNTTGTGYVGGRILASGYMRTTAQGASIINVPRDELFKFQLERNTFELEPYEISLVCASSGDNASVFGSLDWEEISR